jgi:hypothetical protein
MGIMYRNIMVRKNRCCEMRDRSMIGWSWDRGMIRENIFIKLHIS